MQSSQLSTHLPPPYRAPPTPLVLLKAASINANLNCSEPNIAVNRAENSGSSVVRGSGSESRGNTNYVSVETLRDAAQKMFARNRMERSSLATSTAPPQARRHSYAVNNRPALPPTVPPKPNSRPTNLVNAEDAELRNIVRAANNVGNSNVGNSNVGNRNNATPPLPAFLSLTPPPKDSHVDSSWSTSEVRRMSTKSSSLSRSPKEASAAVSSRRREKASGVDGGEAVHAKMSEQLAEEVVDEDLYDLHDAQAIRQQLDGLEAMYAEVLKMLGLRKFGRQPLGSRDQGGGGQLRRGGQLYGSMSSLPSVGNSSVGSRLLNRQGLGQHGGRGANKRFQRLEAHVVTLARSVAALSSQQAKLQQELSSVRLSLESSLGKSSFSPIMVNSLAEEHARRVRKLSQFFGEEPPLLRLFLKRLGYEKFASVLEEAHIGLLELPYVTDNRLERLGLPLGPRSRILQEARKMTQNYNDTNKAMNNNMGQANLQANLQANVQGGSPLGAHVVSGGLSSSNNNNNYNVYIL